MGVTLGHKRNDFFRSVLEGAAFAIRHVVEILEQERNLCIDQMYIGGAAASSKVWNQIIADVTGKKIVTITQSHTEVLGAAIIAGVGVSFFDDYQEAIEKSVKTGDTFEPDPEYHDVYRLMFPIYKDLYLDLEHHFEKIAKLNLPQGWINKGCDYS